MTDSQREAPQQSSSPLYRVKGLRPPVQSFIHTEEVGALILLAAAAAAIIWANSPWSESYFDFWHTHITIEMPIISLHEDLKHLVNDGLMAIFFFVVGLEIKRELLHGELSSVRKASLPVLAAVGGMSIPALIYLLFNGSGEAAVGWGIPMATDIAFAIGVLALLGRRVPMELRVFLLGLAVVDDLGAITVIALFYTDTIEWMNLWISLAVLAAVVVSVRVGIRSMLFYIVLGVSMWYFFLESGVHATLAGVLLAAVVPAGPFAQRREYESTLEDLIEDFKTALDNKDDDHAETVLEEIEKHTQIAEGPLENLEHKIHPWVSLAILPLFALANAGITLTGDTLNAAAESRITIGIAVGLLAGNPIGIFGMTWLAVRLGIGQLPSGVSWVHVLGASFLAGIGFTVAIFISGIAFDDPALVEQAKMGIFAASIAAATIGYAILRFTDGGDSAAPPSTSSG